MHGDFQAPCDDERNGPHRDACSRMLHEMSFCSQFPMCLSLQIDFTRPHAGETAQVERLEYDPNRSARIALVRYPEGLSPLIYYSWHASRHTHLAPYGRPWQLLLHTCMVWA